MHRLAGRFVTRRVVLVAVIAVGAGLTVAGCRNDPSVAAYVGSETITEAQVEAIFAEAGDRGREQAAADAEAARKQAQAGGPTPTPSAASGAIKRPSRGDVLAALVLGRACEALRAKEGFPVAPVAPEAAAQGLGLPDSKYVRERAKTEACLNGAFQGADVQPTDAELRDIYDRAVKGGVQLPPFEQVKEGLRGDEGLRGGLARKHRVEQMVSETSVTLSPRYQPLTWPVSFLRSGEPIIIAVVASGTGAVRDL